MQENGKYEGTPSKWTEQLAAALVTRSALSAEAVRGLERAFCLSPRPEGVSEMR
jgi:hypothetical protein